VAQLTAGGAPVYRDSAGHLFDDDRVTAGSTSTAAAMSITSTFSFASAADGYNATVVKSGPASLLSIDAYNARTGGVKVALYDQTTTPVVGTDTPKWTVYLPGVTPGGRDWDTGLRFDKGLAFALIPDDAAGLMAGDIQGLNLGYAA
jgi:hypothetical protein